MKVLVTGAAGFIGSKLAFELARRGEEVVGIDNFSACCDVRLPEARLKLFGGFRILRLDIADKPALDALFAAERFDKVVNLAARTGVRQSMDEPYAFLESNLVGFLNVLEACRNYGVKHLVFASSSSVYGMNEKVPYAEEDRTDRPVSLYAATKQCDERMAYSYCKLHGIAMTGLRYFTVYGPWGRPDMAPMLFADAIRRGEPVRVFNGGDLYRDFTYIDDIVAGTLGCIGRTPAPDADGLPYRIYNIGCGQPVRLTEFIAALEHAMGREAQKVFLPMQPGDVYQTFADTSRLEAETGFRPRVSLREGIALFAAWHNSDENPLK